MTIVFSSLAPVKPARPFGLRLLKSLPTHSAPYTASESAWWAQESDRLAKAREDASIDQAFGEAEALDRHERGLGCY